MKSEGRNSSFFIKWRILQFWGNLRWWGLLQSWWRKPALWTLNEPAQWAMGIPYKTDGKSCFCLHDDPHHKNGNPDLLLRAREKCSGHVAPTAVHGHLACPSWKFLHSSFFIKWRMKNEEWRMKNEEWRMWNEEWRMKNEEWRILKGAKVSHREIQDHQKPWKSIG